MDYKIEITTQWEDEEKHSLIPQEVAYKVTVYGNGNILTEKTHIPSMEKAGAIALEFETFFKYFKEKN